MLIFRCGKISSRSSITPASLIVVNHSSALGKRYITQFAPPCVDCILSEAGTRGIVCVNVGNAGSCGISDIVTSGSVYPAVSIRYAASGKCVIVFVVPAG